MNLNKYKSVLVTGATGSFGRQIVKDLFLQGFDGKIRLMARNEHRLLEFWDQQNNAPRIELWVGDVRDQHRTEEAVAGVDLVFHAAALKQVHFCEFHPDETVLTNIMGALNICRAILRSPNRTTLVAISTDKAVEPVNVMGMSKAIQERMIASFQRRADSQYADIPRNLRPSFVCARYGNVIRSQGSVIPKWIRLCRIGEKVGVCDPRMTRFLFRIEEATQLAFHAANHANDYGGCIFIRKMKSAFMKDVAMEIVSRWHTDQDSPEKQIVYTGIRQGEKIHETLVSVEEMRRCEDQGEYYAIHPYTELNQTYEQVTNVPFTSANAETIRGKTLTEVLERAGCFDPKADS